MLLRTHTSNKKRTSQLKVNECYLHPPPPTRKLISQVSPLIKTGNAHCTFSQHYLARNLLKSQPYLHQIYPKWLLHTAGLLNLVHCSEWYEETMTSNIRSSNLYLGYKIPIADLWAGIWHYVLSNIPWSLWLCCHIRQELLYVKKKVLVGVLLISLSSHHWLFGPCIMCLINEKASYIPIIASNVH